MSSKAKNNDREDKRKVHNDTIHSDTMNIRVLHNSPNPSKKNAKDIEKKLYEVFKKYETNWKSL